MPLYSYKCDTCGDQFEEIREMVYRNEQLGCKKCPSGITKRNMIGENVVFFDDISEHFDYSLGEKVTGRRDKATKYRAAGMTMIGAPHGGDITSPEKRLYSDEQYYDEVIKGAPLDDNQKRLDDALEQVEVK